MLETKHNPLELCEFKFSDEEWQVTGYASVFGSVDKMGDTVAPGAFADSLKSGEPISMRFEHLRWVTPGKWESAVEDEKGLRMMGYLTRGHSVAQDLRASMRHGTIRGLSIGYYVEEGGYEKNEHGGRDLKKINLVEVSFTATPMEPKATIESFKSEVESIRTLGDMEDFLREAGNLSKSMATYLVGHMKAICRSDSGKDAEALKALQGVMVKYDLRALLHK